MKRFLTSILVAIFLTVLVVPTVSADSQVNLDLTKEIIVSDHLTLHVFSDGRIEPVKNSSSLTENEIDIVLDYMGFNEDEISGLPLSSKQTFVEYGGKKVDLELKSFHHYSTTSDGSLYEVSGEDALNSFIMDNCGPSSCSDGIWSSNTYVLDVGKHPQTNQRRYFVHMNWYWSSQPSATWTDSVAIFWGSNLTAYAGTHDGFKWWLDPLDDIYREASINVDVSSTEGISGSFLISYGQQGGAIMQEILVDASDKGKEFTIAYGYAHPHVPTILDGVSVGIGPIGISFRGTFGDRWTWQQGFVAQW